MTKQISGSPFLYSDDGKKIQGFKNPDGTDSMLSGSSNRLIADRCSPCYAEYASGSGAISRTKHFAGDDISQCSIKLWNGYLTPSVSYERSATLEAQYQAQIEDINGNILGRFLWNGSNTKTAVLGEVFQSDPLDLSAVIPKGAGFFIKHVRYSVGGTKMIAMDRGSLSGNNSISDSGEGMIWGNWDLSSANNTIGTGGPILTTSSNFTARPLAILGTTGVKSVAIFGDSRQIPSGALIQSVFDFRGRTGEGELSINKLMPYVNLCISSNRAQYDADVSSMAVRISIAQHCTDIILAHGINDLAASRTEAQIFADFLTIAGFFPGKRIHGQTVPPKTTSSDSWATVANQTVDATSNPNRVILNRKLRAGRPPFSSVIDVAKVIEYGVTQRLCNQTAASNQLTVLNGDMTELIVGSAISGLGLADGITVSSVASNVITMSATATTTFANNVVSFQSGKSKPYYSADGTHESATGLIALNDANLNGVA